MGICKGVCGLASSGPCVRTCVIFSALQEMVRKHNIFLKFPSGRSRRAGVWKPPEAQSINSNCLAVHVPEQHFTWLKINVYLFNY